MASVLLPQLGEEFETASMANLVPSFSEANSKILEHFFLQILCDFLSENEHGRRREHGRCGGRKLFICVHECLWECPGSAGPALPHSLKIPV